MNAVQLIGRLTRDPDVRLVTQTQMLVARFSIAIDRKVDKNGEKQADFPSIVCFGKTAELVEKYLGKGQTQKSICVHFAVELLRIMNRRVFCLSDTLIAIAEQI